METPFEINQVVDILDVAIINVRENRICYCNAAAKVLLSKIHKNVNSFIGLPFFVDSIRIPRKLLVEWQRKVAKGELWEASLLLTLGDEDYMTEVKVKPLGGYGKQGDYIILAERLRGTAANDSDSNNDIYWLSTILDDVPFMIVQWNEKAEVLSCNKRYADFLGHSKEELIGRSFLDFIPESDINILLDVFDQMRRGGDCGIAENRIAIKGKQRWAFWLNNLIWKKGEQCRFFSVGIETTDTRNWEHEFNILKKQYVLLSEYFDHPLFVVNRELNVTFANAAAIQWFEHNGLNRSSKPEIFFELTGHPKAPEFAEYFRQNQESIKPKVVVYGTNEIYERRCYPIGRKGETASILVELLSVSSFRREEILLRLEGELTQTIVDAAKTCIVKMNEQLEIIYVNNGFATILKYEQYELSGEYFPNLLAPAYRDAILRKLLGLSADGMTCFQEDIQLFNKDGEEVWMEMLVGSIEKREEGDFSITAIFNDITTRKEQEAKLQSKLVQVQNMKEKMDKFYSIIGHDIKNPFVTIRLISEGLLQHAESQNDEVGIKYLNYIHRLSEEGLELLDNLVSWTKSVIDGVEFQPSLFDLSPLCEDVKNHFFIAARTKGIAIKNNVDDSLKIYADRNMIKTVIRNLLSNALKFSNSGGVVSIDAEKQSAKVVITVSDNGVGIDPNQIPYLFKLTSKNIGVGTANEVGSGIGLRICTNFVQKHGGVMTIDSQKGVGTKVQVVINNEIPKK